MGRIVVIAEVGPDGGLSRISAEVATLARTLAAQAKLEVTGLVVAPDPAGAAAELARYLPEVESVAIADAADHVPPQRVAAEAVRAAGAADYLFLGAPRLTAATSRELSRSCSAGASWPTRPR